MNDAQLRLLGPWRSGDAPTGEGLETSISHTWPWPPWVAACLIIAAAVVVLAVYAREPATVDKRWRALLAALRVAAFCLLVWMMHGWLRTEHRTDLPDLVVMMDVSQSMAHVDPADRDAVSGELTRRLAALGLDQASRLNLAKLVLLEQDARLIAALRQRYNLKWYCVGAGSEAQLVTDDPTETIVGWQATDGASRLGTALREVLEAQRGRPTAAILVLTDGITTEGRTLSEVAEYARRKSAPLLIVGLGNDEPQRDARLSDLVVDDVVFSGDLVHFDFRLGATGLAGRELKLRLRREGADEVLAELTETAATDHESKQLRLTFRPESEGEFDFVVEAEPLDGEVTTENNRLTRRIRVRDEAIRVLLVQDYPNWEFRFLKSLLGRSLRLGGTSSAKAFELTTVLHEADRDYAEQDETAERVFPVSRDELFRYDVIVMGDVDPSYLSRPVMESLAAFVQERGGGLVFIAGARHMPLAYRNSPLTTLFPVDLDEAKLPDANELLDARYEFTPQPTALGLSTGYLQLGGDSTQSMRIWHEFPPQRWLLEAPTTRPGARVLIEHPSRQGSEGRNLPVVTLQFIGAGKVIMHNVDETYRWMKHPDGDLYFARYWIQTLRYLSRSKLLDGNRAVEMPQDQDQFQQGESIPLVVRFLDDRLAPPLDDGVTVVVEQSGGQRRQFTLRRDATARGLFTATVGDLPAGVHRAWMATPTVPGNPPARQFTVVAPPGERARLEADLADLKLAAQRSEGRFYTLADVARLPKELPPGKQVRIQSLPPSAIWNAWPFAATFVALLITEWLLRKRLGLA